jgi:hypothetical protein
VRIRGLTGLDDDGVHNVSHYFAHLVMSGAMLYMFIVGMYASTVSAAPPVEGWTGYAPLAGSMPLSMGGSANDGHTVVAALFVLVLIGSAVWQLDGLTRVARLAATGDSGLTVPLSPLSAVGSGCAATGRPLLAPRLEALGHVVMCVTMGYMLVSLL